MADFLCRSLPPFNYGRVGIKGIIYGCPSNYLLDTGNIFFYLSVLNLKRDSLQTDGILWRIFCAGLCHRSTMAEWGLKGLFMGAPSNYLLDTAKNIF